MTNSQIHLGQPASIGTEPIHSLERLSAVRIIALLPFLVKGALSLSVLRALHALGAEVVVAYCAENHGYPRDLAADFAGENRLIDLSSLHPHLQLDRLRREIADRRITLVLQIGAFSLYPLLPYLKEQVPTLRLVDILYNEVHTSNHFLYEPCFDGVIVESQYMVQYVRDGTLKADPCVYLVESGVDLEYFIPRAPSFDTDELRIGYIGRLSPEKNPLGFIDMFESLAERLPNLSAIIAGTGPMVDEVRERVAASPAKTRLVYLGRLESIVDTLQALDALFVPSTLDGRPNVVMEANACGVPVIAAPVGGIPELVEQGVNGYVATHTEIDRIVSLLSAWAADPALRSHIRSTCRQAAEARFDRRRMIMDYAAAFRHFASREARC